MTYAETYGLKAKEFNGLWCVEGRDGYWWPNSEAQASLAGHPNPARKVMQLCVAHRQPRQGQWVHAFEESATMIALGKRMRALRKQQQLPVGWCAHRAGWGRSYWYHLEQGRRGGVTLRTLQAVAAALRVEVWQLFEQVED